MTDTTPIPTPVVQTLPFEVRVRRWFQDPTQWAFIAGGTLSLAQLALTYLGLLHLSDQMQFFALVGLNGSIQGLGAFLNYQSSHVIGTKSDVAAAAQAPDAEPVQQ